MSLFLESDIHVVSSRAKLRTVFHLYLSLYHSVNFCCAPPSQLEKSQDWYLIILGNAMVGMICTTGDN